VPFVLTTSAVIMCPHGGRVTLVPRQTAVQIQGGMVLCEGDVIGQPILGCAQPPTPASKPCLVVVSTLPGSSSPKVSVSGRPVHLATLTGLTDGVPPGVVTVVSPGQTVVQA
jgi:hypothetical protein